MYKWEMQRFECVTHPFLHHGQQLVYVLKTSTDEIDQGSLDTI